MIEGGGIHAGQPFQRFGTCSINPGNLRCLPLTRLPCHPLYANLSVADPKRTSLLQFTHPRMISCGATTKARWRSAPTCCATPINEEMVMVDEMLMVSAAHLDLASAG